MKKFLLSIVGFFLCAVCAFSVVGCKPTDFGTTTTDTTKVLSNGGSSVVYNNELYFVNGMNTNDGEHNGLTVGSVYKVALGENEEIAENAEYTKVVDTLVGYNKGSINIIGDFLYYTTPGTGENKSGQVLFNKTRFMRKNLVNGKTQEIYKTAQDSADEAVTFAYYKTGTNQENLHLVVYEATSKTLKSFKIGNQIEEVISKENITNAVFSEKMGSTLDNAENFVFYTMAADANTNDTSTNRVFRIGADGSNDTLINDNANLTIEGVKAGKLILTATFGTVTNTYAVPVNSTTQNGELKIASTENSKNPHINSDQFIICRNKYDNIMYIEEADGSIATIYLEGKNLTYTKFSGNTGAELTYTILTFSSTPTLNFIGTFKDSHDDNHSYVVFAKTESSKNIVYKAQYTFDNLDESFLNKEKQLSTSNIKVESSSSEELKVGNMQAEIVGNYVYAFVNDEDSNILMHRVNLYTPKELADQKEETQVPGEGEGEGSEGEESEDKEDLSIKAAEQVGGTDL